MNNSYNIIKFDSNYDDLVNSGVISPLNRYKYSFYINSDKLLVPVIDARHGCVYAAIYNKDRVILKPSYIKLEDLYNKLSSECVFITNDEIDLNSEKSGYIPNILNIVNKFVDKKEINPHLVNTEYLKLTAAEESKLNGN